jgi:twitching motility two-component system response regulator PilG
MEETAATFKKRRVLVVDDSPTVQEQLLTFLRERGYLCHGACNAEQALAAVEKSQYDMVFLDVVMPGMDGFAACKKIKAMASYKQVPVVLLTSRNSTTDRVHGLMAGCTRYLTKPFDPVEVDQLMTYLCPSYRENKAARAFDHLRPIAFSGLS